MTPLIHTQPTPADLALDAANWLTDYCRSVLARQPWFTIALSGGSTPKALHLLLASDAFRERIDWTRWRVFWGDERYVPVGDERNNARMARETLLDHVPIPPTQIHPMRTDITPEESIAEYSMLLHESFDNQPNSFDLTLLGLGDDGHTLSLFPGTAVVAEDTDWTAAFFLEAQAMYRLTLTAPVVNRSAAVAFLVAGSAKAAPLHEVLHGDYRPDLYPAQRIRPTAGELHFFVDQAAGAVSDEVAGVQNL
jgi:6-phosphogluconolactonase